ncbi:MAG: hypothetical protein IJ759_01165 [Bacteroidales bacterium]|nr:hypothetical protein [Bacteroidales bacterium]
MKKIFKNKIWLILALIIFFVGLTSCSSWRKTKCGECPRWSYNTTSADTYQKV